MLILSSKLSSSWLDAEQLYWPYSYTSFSLEKPAISRLENLRTGVLNPEVEYPQELRTLNLDDNFIGGNIPSPRFKTCASGKTIFFWWNPTSGITSVGFKGKSVCTEFQLRLEACQICLLWPWARTNWLVLFQDQYRHDPVGDSRDG